LALCLEFNYEEGCSGTITVMKPGVMRGGGLVSMTPQG
jgi:hypothetical protein